MDTAIRIDLLPAGVHYCYPTRSDLQGGAHLVRECPTEAIRHDVVLPRLIREVPAGLNAKRKGVMSLSPFALRVIVRSVDTSTTPQLGGTMRRGHNAELDVFQSFRENVRRGGAHTHYPAWR